MFLFVYYFHWPLIITVSKNIFEKIFKKMMNAIIIGVPIAQQTSDEVFYNNIIYLYF